MIKQGNRSGLNTLQRQNDEPKQQTIIVEEAMDCRQANLRFFNLVNQETHLNVTISQASNIVGCSIDGREIVVNDRLCGLNDLESWALCDKALVKMTNLPWGCHVRGSELILTVPNGFPSMTYELNDRNELHSFVKVRGTNMQNKVTYFNLNNTKELTPIDGHTISVQCNGNLNRIQVQDTKLLHPCKSSVLPKTLLGDIPFQLVHHDAGASCNGQRNSNLTQDDLIVCDAIFSLKALSSLDCLSVRLQYGNRVVQVEVNSLNHRHDTNQIQSNPSTSKMRNEPRTSNIGTGQADSMNMSHSTKQTTNELPASTSSTIDQSLSNSNQDSEAVTIRVRVRITNFGVCILPLMMKNYHTKYSFFW